MLTKGTPRLQMVQKWVRSLCSFLHQHGVRVMLLCTAVIQAGAASQPLSPIHHLLPQQQNILFSTPRVVTPGYYHAEVSAASVWGCSWHVKDSDSSARLLWDSQQYSLPSSNSQQLPRAADPALCRVLFQPHLCVPEIRAALQGDLAAPTKSSYRKNRITEVGKDPQDHQPSTKCHHAH